MKLNSNKIRIIFYIAVLFLLFPKQSYAYLDPGTGSYIFQLVIAGILGGTIFFRSTTKKVKDLFKSKKSNKTDREKSNRDR